MDAYLGFTSFCVVSFYILFGADGAIPDFLNAVNAVNAIRWVFIDIYPFNFFFLL
jgi:hypothetical protein